MTWRLIGTVSLVLGLAACTPDADDDGLSNAREDKLGTNPDVADTDHDGVKDGKEMKIGTDPKLDDSDGDGLSDGDELDNGADPLKVDTDDDGYTDRDEVFEGHDPADEKDKIYAGDWPYFYEKKDLKGGSLKKEPKSGKLVGHLIGRDWFGNNVDLWDFHNTDKPILVDVSAQWCPPCNDLARWLHGDPSMARFDVFWPGIREAVENGDIYWVTILEEENSGAGAVTKTSKEWHQTYPDDPIPVIADHKKSMASYLDLHYYPTLFTLNPDLTIDFVNGTGADIDGDGYPDPYGVTLDKLSASLTE